MEASKLFGAEQVNNIEDIVSRKENVVILANHQTEADPQVLFSVITLLDYVVRSNILQNIYSANKRLCH